MPYKIMAFEFTGADTLSSNSLAAGAFGEFPRSETLFADIRSMQSALGAHTVATPYTGPGATAISQSLVGGVDDGIDYDMGAQMKTCGIPVRIRSDTIGGFETAIQPGTHLFASLVDSKADSDLVSAFSPPVLNMLHEKRAIYDARVAAGAHDEYSVAAATLRLLTATTPSEFAQKWGYLGAAVEPAEGNEIASEPMWTVAGPSYGRVSMPNIFGTNVRPFDQLCFVCRLEPAAPNMNVGKHAPRVTNVLRITGYAGRSLPTLCSTKTGIPSQKDVDSIAHNVQFGYEARKIKFDINAPPGSRYKFEDVDLGQLRGKTALCDLYENGFIVRVGIVTEDVPRSAPQALIDAAHNSIEAYNKLPKIDVIPAVLRR